MTLDLNGGIKQRHSASVENQTKQPDLKQNPENNSKITEKEIETEFQKIFEKYNQKFSFEILQKMFGDEYSKANLLKCDAKDFDILIQKLDIAFLNAENKKSNNVGNAETLEEFFEKYANKDSGTIDIKNDESISFASSELKSILSKMNDDEKDKYTDEIIEKLKNQSDLLKIFFESIENKELRSKCADNIVNSELLSNTKYVNVIKTATKYTSVEGSNKALNMHNAAVYNYEHKAENKVVIDKVYNDKVPVEQLNDEEQAIIKEYNELLAVGTEIVKGSLCNENFSEEDIKQFLNRANDFYKKTHIYSSFLEDIANFISDSNNKLNFSKEKAVKILDNITNNDFSKTIKKMSEKTATDEKTGGFKTDKDASVIENSTSNAEKIKETITLNTPKEDKTFVVERTQQTTVSKENSKQESFFEKYTNDFIANIIKGTSKDCSLNDKQIAVNRYKQFKVSDKLNLLNKATGEMASKIIQVTEGTVLSKYLQVFGFGKTFEITQQMKKAIEEDEKKEEKKAS